MHGAPNNPTKRLHNSSAARGRLQRLAAHDIFHGGEARRKRLKVRTKRTKTRSSPRRFRKSRSRSSILHGAPVRQLAMHWATPLRRSVVAFAAAPLFKRGVAYAMPLVGDRVRFASHSHRSLRRRRLFASATAHAPAAASSRRLTLFPSWCTTSSPSTLDPTCTHLSPPSPPPPPVAPACRHGDRTAVGSGAVRVPWLCAHL